MPVPSNGEAVYEDAGLVSSSAQQDDARPLPVRRTCETSEGDAGAGGRDQAPACHRSDAASAGDRRDGWHQCWSRFRGSQWSAKGCLMMNLRDHLTNADNPALAELINNTPPGMAHWSGTGPADRHCAQCAFYRAGTERCGMFVVLLRRTGLRAVPRMPVPALTWACKYFKMASAGALKRRGW